MKNMNTRRITAVTVGVLLTMVGAIGTAMAWDPSETYMGSYNSKSNCERTGASNGYGLGERWSGYRCEGRWERGPRDDEYRYALYVKNFQADPEDDWDIDTTDLVGDID
ncbi:hypothetical protein L3Q67_38320 [Saccharothrix sp. AJ9571]|nr:hypothetical protein L3Q67_38320 [Saccharothrix sp. AJ9571]